MQTPHWKPTSKTCGKAWHDAEGIWRPCGGPLLEWRQRHPETGNLMMTCWHCKCGKDSFKAEPAPGSPAALARAAALETSGDDRSMTMQKIEIGMEESWFKDPGVAEIFGGRADVHTIEGTNIIIRIDDEFIDMVELTVARFHDDDWVWDTPDAYGYAEDIDAAKTAAKKRGWHEAMLRLREEVATEVEGPLDRIAKRAAETVRKRGRKE